MRCSCLVWAHHVGHRAECGSNSCGGLLSSKETPMVHTKLVPCKAVARAERLAAASDSRQESILVFFRVVASNQWAYMATWTP